MPDRDQFRSLPRGWRQAARALLALGRGRNAQVDQEAIDLGFVRELAPGVQTLPATLDVFERFNEHALGLRRLVTFEAGVGAMNLPMNAAQTGAENTRAMHPRTLLLAQSLFSRLFGSDFSVEAPFIFVTKGELCQSVSRNLHALPTPATCPRPASPDRSSIVASARRACFVDQRSSLRSAGRTRRSTETPHSLPSIHMSGTRSLSRLISSPVGSRLQTYWGTRPTLGLP